MHEDKLLVGYFYKYWFMTNQEFLAIKRLKNQ